MSATSLELLTTVTRAGPEADFDSLKLALSSLAAKPGMKHLQSVLSEIPELRLK